MNRVWEMKSTFFILQYRFNIQLNMHFEILVYLFRVNKYKFLSESSLFIQEHPRKLIPELCKQFYHLGWVTGTGGGISIKLE